MKQLRFILWSITLISSLFCCNEIKKIKQVKAATKQNKKELKIDSLKEQYCAVFDSIDGDSKVKKLTKALKKQFKKNNLNGCVLIEQAGVTLIKECNGTTCLKCDSSIVLTPNSIFQLASVSKTFTAIATLKLVEEKKISLEDSVQKFYPNFPYHGVTIEQLLSHRSGLPNYLYAFDDSSRSCQNPSNQTLMEWFTLSAPKKYRKPGKRFSYNNTNYAVLGALIETVSGSTFENYMTNSIFKPLNMNHTFFFNTIPDSIPKTFGHENKRRIEKDFFDDIKGDKGIYSSLNDLKIWHKSLINNKIISKKSMELVFTPKSFEKPGIKNYGLGFRMITEKNSKQAKYIYHTGWWKGYNTLFWFDPKTNSFISILTNNRNSAIYKTADLIKILNTT